MADKDLENNLPAWNMNHERSHKNLRLSVGVKCDSEEYLLGI
jgi:hypothetical protein